MQGSKITLIAGYNLVETQHACPEQYSVYRASDDKKRVGYFRLRHGAFEAHAYSPSGQLVYSAGDIGTGEYKGGRFSDHERLVHLTAAIAELDAYLSATAPIVA